MGTTKARRWWQRRPGRWQKSFEEALASGSPDRVAIAWAIILQLGGKHGSIIEAARLAGVPKQTLHSALTGESAVTLDLKQALARGFHVPVESIRPAHPFAVQGLAVYVGADIEPGDEKWPAVWETMRIGAPEAPSADELRKRYPALFPTEA